MFYVVIGEPAIKGWSVLGPFNNEEEARTEYKRHRDRVTPQGYQAMLLTLVEGVDPSL